MSMVTEVLLVSGVALDLVGAGVLAHGHNAESIVELREQIDEGDEGTALGQSDEISTHAMLLAEKRIGFAMMTCGLLVYLIGLVLKSPEDAGILGLVVLGVVLLGLLVSVLATRNLAGRIRAQALAALEQSDPEALPEQ